MTEEKPAAPEKPEAQPKEEHKIEVQQKKTETPAQPSKPAFRSQNQQKNQHGGQQKPQQNQPKVNFPQQAERGASRAADRFARPAQQQNQSKKPEVKENRPVQSQIPQPKKAEMRGGGESVEAMKKTRVIDTRASSVDLSKYDERLESFVPESARRRLAKNSRTGRILMRADAQTRMQLLLQSSEKRSLKRLKNSL